MTPRRPYKAALLCHPATRSEAVRAVGVCVLGAPEGVLALTFSVTADLARLRLPSPGPARRGELLWKHTCFEAFVARKDSAQYLELNFSPSGEWAAYAFHGYRDGGPLAQELNPTITARRAGDRFELDALVELDRLPGWPLNAPLRLALSAVIEEEAGVLSYWALQHAPGRPDFHHPLGFALELDWSDGDGARREGNGEKR